MDFGIAKKGACPVVQLHSVASLRSHKYVTCDPKAMYDMEEMLYH